VSDFSSYFFFIWLFSADFRTEFRHYWPLGAVGRGNLSGLHIVHKLRPVALICTGTKTSIKHQLNCSINPWCTIQPMHPTVIRAFKAFHIIMENRHQVNRRRINRPNTLFLPKLYQSSLHYCSCCANIYFNVTFLFRSCLFRWRLLLRLFPSCLQHVRALRSTLNFLLFLPEHLSRIELFFSALRFLISLKTISLLTHTCTHNARKYIAGVIKYCKSRDFFDPNNHTMRVVSLEVKPYAL
jgi:hypothetical protein